MEQKKTLWIIAAVGAFLLVVIGAAAILYSPAKNPTPAYASVSPVAKTNTVPANYGWTNSPANEGLTAPQTTANDVVVVTENATVYEIAKSNTSGTTIDLNSLKQEIVPEPQPQSINITVNIPETKNEEPKVTQVPVSVSKAEPKTETKTVQKSTASVKVNTAPAKAKTASTPAPKAEPQKTQFWVQVAAYSNKKGAEGARSILDSNKIPADIFTFKDNKDKLYYRVRVGPYTTKSEAEYWRTRIIKIDEFSKAESYVTSTVQ